MVTEYSMSLSSSHKEQIKQLLRKKLDDKLQKYERESASMPFLVKIMQEPSQVAAYSFIHSISTTLGQSIYEEMAKIIASSHFEIVETGYDVTGTLSDEASLLIAQILHEYKNKTRKADKLAEVNQIVSLKSSGGENHTARADLFLKNGDHEYYFEIKTAKPNIDIFNKSKEKLLVWVALRKKPVTTVIAIPYNPMYPKPYTRFTIQGVLDLEQELYVAERFWDFLGGYHTYIDILEIFDEIGMEYKEKIQEKISAVASKKLVFSKDDLQKPSVREPDAAQQYLTGCYDQKEN
ncbi:MAG: TdeIII family type II restriction endonuclease [Methanoregula sp.]|jgi:hypothetical protein|nr:TdeIII family type II restriction endonuclease [Methanoregula sp.]